MFKGMGNVQQMMQEAQKMQARLKELQEELVHKTVERSAGGGMVKVVVNGRQEVISIAIEKEIVNPDDVQTLQDLVLAAVNDAIRGSQEIAQKELAAVAPLNIPGLGNLFG